MKLKADEISTLIQSRIEQFETDVHYDELGEIIFVGDGIARVYGLDNAAYGELIEFPGPVYGMALNLEEDSVGVVLFGSETALSEGLTAKRTGRIVEVPCGSGVCGRVINPLGVPLDGKGSIATDIYYPVEKKAPGVVFRQPVKESLETGIKAIDSMIPIGRGQRELIIGDRQTGKTAIAVDTIINQKGKNVKCIYVAVGQKGSTIANVVKTLSDYGSMEYTTVVASTSDEPAPLQYLAPYSGCAIGEYFRDQGQHALVIYDDLTKQAWAYRQISLLLRRPPGREAYPGDVFYLHSRLLERAAKMREEFAIVRKGQNFSDRTEKDKLYYRPDGEAEAKTLAREKGEGFIVVKNPLSGGSLTALPIIETQQGDVSAYIPTNVISITDGQIYLQPELFYAGIRPAINAGISVSRVGGSAQVNAMRQVAGSLRLDLAQYREMEAFAKFGSDMDKSTRQQLNRGARLVEILKQSQHCPLPVAVQISLIYAGIKGFTDNIPLDAMARFEKEFISNLENVHSSFCDELTNSGILTAQLESQLISIIKEFINKFSV